MRKCVLLLLLCSGPLWADIQVRDGKISANFQSQSLNRVITQLQRQTGVRFSVEEGVGSQQVSASFQDKPLAEGLKKILEGTGINYAVLSDDNGKAEAIFIGGSQKPGTPPRRLDNRPVGNYPGRSVVNPVTPPPQPAAVPPPNPDNAQRQPEEKPEVRNPSIDLTPDVPTGGGFVPPNSGVELQGKPQPPQDQEGTGEVQEEEIEEEE